MRDKAVDRIKNYGNKRVEGQDGFGRRMGVRTKGRMANSGGWTQLWAKGTGAEVVSRSRRPDSGGPRDYGNYVLTGREKSKYFCLAGGGLFFIGYLFYLNLFLSAAMAMLVFPLKRFYIQLKVRQQKEQLRQQFRDLLYSLSSSVAAGRQMGEALAEGRKNLSFIYEENQLIMVELSYMIKSIQESRTTEELILKDFAYRSGVEEIINFADVYSTCRSTGANVNQMIARAAEVIMDKMTIDREIHTITAQKKAESKIISAMPVLVIFFLNVASPGYLYVLYHTVAGRIVMTAALGSMFISYYIMNKMLEVRL
ncbi:hypothetical protein Ami103574_08010 [Aminipila butyrica]|uniref:Type ii secretion system (T2ss) protein f n=1 Tax=Aminipila butyrica TaxID=433296 RepID=A0A858BWJ2_9FIRM|nr:hypothetical protein [Aminipila butyrica]QIB69270.1 hypothetical protein Ami103574_08010 [Aminipila butyrica]